MSRLTTVFIFSLAAGFLVARGALSKDVETLTIGSQVPELNLPGVDDRTYRLAEFDDAKVLVVVFTCNYCPTAQAYEQRILDLHRDYRDRGVRQSQVVLRCFRSHLIQARRASFEVRSPEIAKNTSTKRQRVCFLRRQDAADTTTSGLPQRVDNA